MMLVTGDCSRCSNGKLIETVSRDWFVHEGRVVYYKMAANVCNSCGNSSLNKYQLDENNREINRKKLEACKNEE